MADAARVVERIRAQGANVVLEDGKLRIVNRGKLTGEALAYIRSHAAEIAAHLDEAAVFDERAAIIEFDGRTPRQWAHAFADILIRQRPPNVSDADWSWFVTIAGRIIDEAPAPEGASW